MAGIVISKVELQTVYFTVKHALHVVRVMPLVEVRVRNKRRKWARLGLAARSSIKHTNRRQNSANGLITFFTFLV